MLFKYMCRIWIRPVYASLLGIMWFAMLSGCASAPQEKLPLSKADAEHSLQLWIEEDKAYLSGILDETLPAELTGLIREHPNVRTLVLVDVPGSVDQQATMESARLLRRVGINTEIARTGYVLSGGVDLFLGGVNREIGAGAGVGVHSWSDSLGAMPDKLVRNDPVHATYVNFYLEMGVPERFYWFSLEAAPPERIYFLSPEETYDYQLATR